MADTPETILKEIFLEKTARNPSFSLRAFGRSLGVAPSGLSEILGGKRTLTPQLAYRLVERLSLTAEKRQTFLDNIKAKPGAKKKRNENFSLISLEEFSLMADWYHWGILNLLQTDSPPRNSKGLARRLGLNQKVVYQALSTLERAGWVEKRGRLFFAVAKSRRAKTPTDVPSGAIRIFHRQLLELANQSLGEVGVDKRDASALVLPCDVGQLPRVKAEIKKFRRRLAKILKEGSKTSVYALAVHFFPLDRES